MKNSIRNISYNAFGFVFPITVALFTTPYIVHKLTPEIYGIYVLSISLIGFMSFLDLGFGQGIIKFVSQYEAKQEYDKINQIINTTLFIYFVMGLSGCILLYYCSGFLAKDVFKVSEQNIQTASLAFNIVAFGFFISFINCNFTNIPKALQRYDISVKIQNTIWICFTILTVCLLYIGKGLIEVLIAWILVQSAGLIIHYAASKRILPTLSIRIKFDRSVFREIFGFSFFTAASSMTGNMVVKVDKLIIGGFLGTSAVTFYNIPFMIAQMGGGFIGAITQHLFPSVSYLHTLGNRQKLVQLYKKSFQYVVSISILVIGGFILLGDDFLRLWMGKEFYAKSKGLLPLLSLVFFFSCSTAVSLWFYIGLGYSRINFLSSLVGSSCYLLAAFYFVPKLGLQGAALSFAFILLPFPLYNYYLLRIIGVELTFYLSFLIRAIILLFGCFLIKELIVIEINSVFIFFLATLIVVITLSLLLFAAKIIKKEEILYVIDKIKMIILKNA